MQQGKPELCKNLRGTERDWSGIKRLGEVEGERKMKQSKIKRLIGTIIGLGSIPWGIFLIWYLNSLGVNFFVVWLSSCINMISLYFYGVKLMEKGK